MPRIKNPITIVGAAGGGGSDVHPTLYAPSISKSTNTLTITNSANNGGFVAGYKILSGGNLLVQQSGTSYTLTNLAKGSYNITVKAYATGFNDSAASNAIAVGVYEFMKNLKNAAIAATLSKTTSGLTVSFTVAAASGYYLPLSISVICNGEAVGHTYNPYTGAVTLTELKASYSGSETVVLPTPTLTISGSVITVDNIALASTVEIFDGSTKAGEISLSATAAQDVIIIIAEGVSTPKLVAPAITLSGTTLTIVDSVNGTGDVVHATSYELYDGNTAAGTINI